MIISTREAEQLFDEVADFSRQASGTGSGQKFGVEDVAAQGFAAVGVRRASRGIVPRRSTAVAKGGIGFVPGPQLQVTDFVKMSHRLPMCHDSFSTRHTLQRQAAHQALAKPVAHFLLLFVSGTCTVDSTHVVSIPMKFGKKEH